MLEASDNSKKKGNKELLSKRLNCPRKIERWDGKRNFQKQSVQSRWEFLPETNPQSVQVKSIFNDFLKVLQDLKIKRIHKLDWQVLLTTNKDWKRACSFANGKIVIPRSHLQVFHTNLEIATVIGHEIAHVSYETRLVRSLYEKCRIRSFFGQPSGWFDDRYTRLFYYARKQEYEADYIGMILMAYAGYDPRAAPLYWAKSTKLKGCYDRDEFLQTHPCGKNREVSLVLFMEEAVDIYTKCPKKKSVTKMELPHL